MKNVLIIVSALDAGGIENMLFNYLSTITLNQYNIDIIVHSSVIGSIEKEFIGLGCRIIHVPSKRKNLIKNLYEINRIIKHGKYEIVHTNMAEQGFSHMFSAWFYKVPIRIIHTHVIFESRKSVLRNMLKKISMSFSNKWVACSKKAGESLFGEKAVLNNEVIILNNAIDTEKYKYSQAVRTEVRRELHIQDQKVIGVIGRFSSEKNYGFLLDVYYQVYECDKDIVLLIIGDGGLRSSIEDKINSLGIERNVKLLGVRQDVCKLLQCMDYFILPSISEGFGMVIIEAQCSGLPCVASNNVPKETSLTELVTYLDLEEGVDFWSDYILKHIRICDSLNRMQYANIVKKAGYDIKKVASKLELIYNGEL